LLLRFNVFTRTRVTSKAGCRNSYHVHVSGAESQLRFLEDIGAQGSRGSIGETLAESLRDVSPRAGADTIPEQVWDRVRDAMEIDALQPAELAARAGAARSDNSWMSRPVGRQRMYRVAEILGDAELEVLATNDIYWDAICEIEFVGKEEVYDATVLGVHNFVANGISIHNSIEQDADVVILLHREDAYEKESTRPGEADLIVAKHRNGPTRDVVVAFQGHYSRFVDMAHG
jgi:replicative DNA helicase